MILIIAYGNNLREDDGAGLLLAERLASSWQSRGVAVQLEAVQQLMPELAATIAGDEVAAVVFVDARMSTSPSDRSVAVVSLDAATQLSPSMGHHVQPSIVLAYAQAFRAGDALPPAWLVTVPGIAFAYGEQLSSFAQTAMHQALEDQHSPLHGLIAALAGTA